MGKESDISGNKPCVTSDDVDKEGGTTETACSSDREDMKEYKESCRDGDLGDVKCSSSQTGKGVFSENPNKIDSGSGIFEKFSH